MEYLIVYDYKTSAKNETIVVSVGSVDEAIEVVRNLLEDGSIAIDAIQVYEAKRKEIQIGIV